MHLNVPLKISGLAFITNVTNLAILSEQDAREAMRVVFSVLTKRICMHKTKFLMNIFKYCLKIILNSMNLQIATQLIIMFNF